MTPDDPDKTLPDDPEQTWLPEAPTTLPPSQSEASPLADLRLDDIFPADSVIELPAEVLPKPGEGDEVGDYEILEEVGRGGMGVVYKARQKSLGRIVALKMVIGGCHASQPELERFRAEAEAVAQLQHPNIVQVYEVSEHNGLPFFSLEFCGGGSLAAKLGGAALPVQDAAAVVETLARAVHAAHQKGVVHRDLKPANVLLADDGTPKITDFGLAKRLNAARGQTQTGAVMGTPSYMAPEQAAGHTHEVGPAADIYSLGAILYELLTGRPPFLAESPLDTVLQVLDRLPERPRAHNADVDAALESICLKCLEKEPDQRYSSALALANDLAAWRAGGEVLAESNSHLRLVRHLLRESRHTELMVLWGRVWQWQALVLFGLFALTELLVLERVESSSAFAVLWIGGLAALQIPTWLCRYWKGPPSTILERQIAQIWALFFAGCLLTGLLAELQQIAAQKVLPLAVVQCAVALGCMAAVLGGSFYGLAIVCALLAFVVALWPRGGPIVFGTVFAVGLYWIGHKYVRAHAAPPSAVTLRDGTTPGGGAPPAAGTTLSMPGGQPGNGSV